jgi:geranylgeranyl diphosphate synthase type I
MWQYQQRYPLKEEIEEIVSSLPEDLCALVKEPLTVSRRGLAVASEQEAPWVLLPLMVCESIRGSYEKALPFCASMQFFMAAGDVFDDIEDRDSPLSLCSKYGTAITNNIATTLLVLGEKAIAKLKDRDIEEETIVRILETINSYYLTACTGQHLDLLYERKLNISEDEYLNVLSLKSASQIECSCYTAALLATDDEKLHDIFKNFGYNLGMIAQITNDISGIITGKDIFKRKITLPVIFALSQTKGEKHTQIEDYYIKKRKLNHSTEQISQLLSNTGAIHYTAIKLESFRMDTSAALNKAEQAGANIERLREFLH